MKTETFKGAVASAYGVTLPKPVDFAGEYEAYETIDEIQAANDMPSNDEALAYRNAQRKANARAKATAEALSNAGIEKPDPNAPDVARTRMIKDALRQNPALTQERAEALVDSLLKG